jgi:DmsE family decaheme c-type cytochrome
MIQLNKRGLLHTVLPLAVALLVGAGLLLGGTGPKAARAAPPHQGKDASQYIGAENCKACHEDLPSKGFWKGFEETPHWKTMLETKGGPSKQGCESCHGPGAEHMNAGGDKTKIFSFTSAKAKEISQTCLSCHTYGEEHSNFARSAHNVNDVTCTDCHSVHKPKEKQFLLVKKQPDLCYSCHLSVKPEFGRPFRHRVNENLLKCTDCHNQHGGFLTRSLRSTSAQDTVCFKCHTDKAGPFVFEHAPVKTEGCVACHTPHGSSNPRLLKRSQINLLCLECHTLSGGGLAPAGPSHDQSQKYQSCTICHVTVHGSNHSSVFFR